MEARAGAVFLVARKPGDYRVSRFDGTGRLISESLLRLNVGRHELASEAAMATFVEVRFGDETIVIGVGK